MKAIRMSPFIVMLNLLVFYSCGQIPSRSPSMHENAEVNPNEAVTLCMTGDFEEGLDLLKTKFSKEKNRPDYWGQVGSCYYLKGDHLKAEMYFQLSLETARKRNVSYSLAHNNLGAIYLKENDFVAAEKSFQAALAAEEEALEPRLNLARLYVHLGKLDEAIKHFNYLEKKHPDRKEWMASKGLLHLLKGNLKQAMKYFAKAEENSLMNKEIGAHYALALVLSNDYERAHEVLKEVSVETPEGENYVSALENLLINQKK